MADTQETFSELMDAFARRDSEKFFRLYGEAMESMQKEMFGGGGFGFGFPGIFGFGPTPPWASRTDYRNTKTSGFNPDEPVGAPRDDTDDDAFSEDVESIFNDVEEGAKAYESTISSLEYDLEEATSDNEVLQDELGIAEGRIEELDNALRDIIKALRTGSRYDLKVAVSGAESIL